MPKYGGKDNNDGDDGDGDNAMPPVPRQLLTSELFLTGNRMMVPRGE